MVLTEIDDSTNTGVIVHRPNNSWSWRANISFLSVFMGVSLTIACGFVLTGAWVILSFSLLEIAILGACIHHCVRQCSRQEAITVTDYEITIESGIRKPLIQKTFKLTWAKFFVSKPVKPWESPTLSIRSHSEEIKIDSFLNQRDKDDLVSQLRRVVPR